MPVGNAEKFSSEMCCQSRINKVVNDFKPVNFVHREKIRTLYCHTW
ncbi:hypothetical protein IBT54_004139 [Pantoea sp. S62]|nr:hypothetical protein [Pantoea sp. S62]